MPRAPPLALLALLAVPAVAGLAGCGGSGTAIYAEAEALEAAGKLDEAAAKFELTCAFGPTDAKCGGADLRATEARLSLAEDAVRQGQFVAAERALLLALLTAGDDGQRLRVEERLAQKDLAFGLRYERTIAMTDKRKVAAVLLDIAASQVVPASTKATEWLQRERPALLAEDVKAACGPEHQGSCSEAWTAMQAAPRAPTAGEAEQVAAAERRRLSPLLEEAQSFLRVFAADGAKQRAFEKCRVDRHGDLDEAELRRACDLAAFGKETFEKKYQLRKNNEDLFRRLLQRLGDPPLARDLQRRKRASFAEGTAQDLPRPPQDP